MIPTWTVAALNTRVPIPTLISMELGMGVSSLGFVAHWKSSAESSAWDFLNTSLEMENYVKLYTSKLFAKGKWDREIKAQWIDRVVDAVGDLHRDPSNRFGIQSIDITW
jgi:hypothetical protein